MRVATLPARTVDVLPAPGSTEPTLPQSAAATVPAPMVASPARDDESVALPQSAADESSVSSWMMLSVVALIAWLLTMIAWWRGRQARHEPSVPVVSSSPSPSLKSACAAIRGATGNGPQLRDALLAWSSVVWRETSPRNLAELAQRCADEPARNAILLLDQQMYASKAEAMPLSKMAETILQWAEQQSGDVKSTKAETGLRALYPS